MAIFHIPRPTATPQPEQPKRKREPVGLKDGHEWYWDRNGKRRQRKTEYRKRYEARQRKEAKAEEREQKAEAERQAKLKPYHRWVQKPSGRWVQVAFTKAEKAEAVAAEQREAELARTQAEREAREQARREAEEKVSQERAGLVAENIGSTFAAIFRAQVPALSVDRGLYSGRIDTNRIGLLGAGNMRVFSQATFHDKPAVAGSLAIVISFADLYMHNRMSHTPQVRLWATSLRILELCARKAKLAVRIFAAGAENDYDHTSGAKMRTWDQLDGPGGALRAVDWLNRDDYNRYTRQKQTVQAAEEWHKKVNPHHRRLTLILTMFPENPGGRLEWDRDAYRSWLTDTGRDVFSWSRESRLFALGVDLEASNGNSWVVGPWKDYGLSKHYEECFPTAIRFRLDKDQDMVSILSAMTLRMARVV